MSIDKRYSYFPSDLPERPPKAPKFAFTRRLSERFNPSKLKRRDSIITPSSISRPVLQETTSPLLFDPTCVVHDPPRKAVSSDPSSPTSELPRISENEHIPQAPTRPASMLAVPVSKNSTSEVPPERTRNDVSTNQDLPGATSPQPSLMRNSLTQSNKRSETEFVRDPVLFSTRLQQAGQVHLSMVAYPGAAPAAPTLSLHINTNSPPPTHKEKVAQSNELVLTWLQTTGPRQQDKATVPPGKQTDSLFTAASTSMARRFTVKPITIIEDEDAPVSPRTRATAKKPDSDKPAVRVKVTTPRQGRDRSRSPSLERRSLRNSITVKRARDVPKPRLSLSQAKPQSPMSDASSPKRSGRFIDSQDATALQEMLSSRAVSNGFQQNVPIKLERRNAVRLSGTSKRDSMELNLGRMKDWGSKRHSGTREDPIEIDSDTSDVDPNPSGYGYTRRRRRDTQPMDVDVEIISIHGPDSDDENILNVPTSPPQLTKSHPTRLSEQQSSGTRECPVCSEEFPIPFLPSLANCTHPPQTCPGCYTGWIAAQLEGSGWTEARCPESKCSVTLSYHEIKEYASPQTFDRYDLFITRAACNEDPNFHWCLACSSGQIHATGIDGNIFTCGACGNKACISHPTTLHTGESCAEYEYRVSGAKERDEREQEEASRRAVEKVAKKCPGRGCVYAIEKNDGCDHMTCSRCRYEFCWICLCDYNRVRAEGNSAHKEDCKYHSRRIR